MRLTVSAAIDERASAIAGAKRQWLMASMDGSSSAEVQGLYEAYRALVIEQVAGIVTRGGAPTA